MRSTSYPALSYARSAGEELPRLIMSWPEFVDLLGDRPSTPYFIQQQFLDQNMTPWGADAINESTMVADVIETTLVTNTSREPRALLAHNERNPDVDLVQAFIEPGCEQFRSLPITSSPDSPSQSFRTPSQKVRSCRPHSESYAC